MILKSLRLVKPVWNTITRYPLTRFNKNFFMDFSTTIDMEGLRCIRCRKIRIANICPHCYIAEVYDWLRTVNERLAETLFRMLPIKQGLDMNHTGLSWSRDALPISHTEMREISEGMCETCERYSDELIHADGRWICRDCELLER